MNKDKENNNEKGGKNTLSNEQKQQLKKYAVFGLMFIIFGASLWLIFAPSKEDKAKAEALQGFNTEIPMPKEEGLIGDKRDAYEQEQLKQRQAERMRSLEDFSAMLGTESKSDKQENVLRLTEEPQKNRISAGGQSSRSQSSIQSSARAYQDINRTLGSFYETPKSDPEKERLEKELEELKSRMEEGENRKASVDEQIALMERSYQMAAKYMPQMQGESEDGQPFQGVNTNPNYSTGNNRTASGKANVVPVSQVNERVVSTLSQEMTADEFVKNYSKPRNLSFFTAGVQKQPESKNTITACIHDDQTVLDGQSVRLRLLETMKAGNVEIPRNTIITGMGKVQGERLGITVVSLEQEGMIIPVELRVFDTDGQQGIFIPGSMEMNAVKEIAANMGTSAGTSISLTSDAGEQFAADMGRSLIQGTSQFFSKKMREVKVNLKAGYKVFLLSPSNLP